jgi:DNA invertase Pin-like site-specific DNA recombinase
MANKQRNSSLTHIAGAIASKIEKKKKNSQTAVGHLAQRRQDAIAKCKNQFREKINGAGSDREQLARLLAELDDGDVVIVTRLDRLARSTRDLLNTLAAIGAAKATFRSLHDAWADTTTPHGRLILTVLGGLAEFERHLIVHRTSEGRKRAGRTACCSAVRRS